MKKTIALSLLLTLTVISFSKHANGEEKVIFEKSIESYSVKLSEVAENSSHDFYAKYNQYLSEEKKEDTYKVYFVDISQLFSFCLNIEYYQVVTNLKSDKIYLMEYQTKNREKTDKLLTKELLNHFGLDLNVKSEKKKVHYVGINSQELLSKHEGSNDKPSGMGLDNGIYTFTNFSIRSLVKILDHAMPDYNLATEIPSDKKYSLKLKKCSEINNLKSNLSDTGLELKEKEVSTDFYHLKTIN